MASRFYIEGGPVGCEWEDVLDIKEWTYNGRRYRSLKAIQPVNYVTVDPVTGEIKPLQTGVQLSLFN